MNQKSKDKGVDLTKALFSGNLSPGTGLRQRPTSTRPDGGSSSIIIEAVDDDFFKNDRKKNNKMRQSLRDPQEENELVGKQSNRLSFSPSPNNRLCKSFSLYCVALVRRDSVVSKDDVQSLHKMIMNEDQFDMKFMESIRESEANFQDRVLSSDKQRDFYNTK